MKKFVPIFFLLLTVCLASCTTARLEGNGKVITENRNTTKFSKINSSGAFILKIKQGTAESIVVQADENLLPEIKTVVNGNTLTIDFGKNDVKPSKSIVIELTVVELEGIDISGSCDIIGVGDWHFQNFALNCSGATESVFTLFAKKFTTDASGSCKLVVKGRVDESVYEISGAGELVASTLESKKVTLDISGSGDAEVFATEFLNVDCSGASEVRYKGSPKITQDVSGASSIKPL
jgi:hypothetical protein